MLPRTAQANAIAPVPANTQKDDIAGLRSSLISRNITMNGHRTSMRLELAMWNALIEICRREKLNIHQICSMVAKYKSEESSFTAAVRVFAMDYYRAAATEEGHQKAGHGTAFLFSAKRDFAAINPYADHNRANGN
ncbi:MAG: hypothetical protein EB059_06125 [Alphaproteobacteria bacterium]|nr:hypothetical protein [Alphaproteobacteria bacterium]